MSAAVPVDPRGPPRQASIDVLRTVAICLMIVVHFVENLSAAHDATSAAVSLRLPAGLAAPLFTFLAGVNYRLWSAARIARGHTSAAVSQATARRGLFLLGTGFAFNALVWLPAEIFNWDILTFMGIALLLLDVARRMPASACVLAGVLIVVISPVLRVTAGYPDSWQQAWFDHDLTLPDVALGCLVVGYFPLFPWLALPLAGFLMAPLVFTAHPADRAPRPLTVAALLGGASAAALVVWPWLPERFRSGAADGWTMFPASTAYVLGSTAGALALLALLHRVLDTGPSAAWKRELARWTGPFSRHSLSIYVLHHLVHVWPLWLAGLALGGDDATVLWQTALPAWAALVLAAACIAACLVLAARVDRMGLPSLERTMRWLCD
jgi:uncharacterized membrane protein